MEKVMEGSQATLDGLHLVNENHTEEYFRVQWERQRSMQLNAIETGTSRALYTKLEGLVELEDQLRDSE